jgi:hypothetical protein
LIDDRSKVSERRLLPLFGGSRTLAVWLNNDSIQKQFWSERLEMKLSIRRSLRKIVFASAVALCGWALPGNASAQVAHPTPHYGGGYYGGVHYGGYYGGYSAVHYGGTFYGGTVVHSGVVVSSGPAVMVGFGIGIGPVIAPVVPVVPAVPVATIPVAPVATVAYVPPPPAVGFVWVAGGYSYLGGSYTWVGGHWAAPTHAVAVW